MAANVMSPTIRRYAIPPVPILLSLITAIFFSGASMDHHSISKIYKAVKMMESCEPY